MRPTSHETARKVASLMVVLPGRIVEESTVIDPSV